MIILLIVILYFTCFILKNKFKIDVYIITINFLSGFVNDFIDNIDETKLSNKVNNFINGINENLVSNKLNNIINNIDEDMVVRKADKILSKINYEKLLITILKALYKVLNQLDDYILDELKTAILDNKFMKSINKIFTKDTAKCLSLKL